MTYPQNRTNTLRVAAVSVVIPCYRCSGTIERAVVSVWVQSTRPAEVILIDDNSADGTLVALYTLQKQYPEDWVKIIALERNSGPGEARNAGWTAASQIYVAFLDADDSWHPQKIELQYQWMTSHPEVALTGHACELVTGERPIIEFDGTDEDDKFKLISATTLLMSNAFPTRSVMLKRDLLQRFSFKRGKYRSEDYLLWCEICLGGNLCYRSSLQLARLYKSDYGEGGLSGDLWAMEKGALDTYRSLCSSGYIRPIVAYALYVWSLAKYIRRLLIVWRRRTFP